jgi:phenylalanyl-tRNA synthetase beta chain
MGGASTEISADTTDVVLEAAHFDPPTIARASRRHRLSSEASRRFERGVDDRLAAAAAFRAAGLLVELGGGRIEPAFTDAGGPADRAPIEIAADLPSRVVGVDYPAEQVVDALTAVGADVVSVDGRLRVTPPSWRPDLTDPYDLVEEVARLVGYDQVPSVLPAAPPGQGLTHHQQLRRRVGRALAGAGLSEVMTFPFVGDASYDVLGLPQDDPRRRSVRIANPLSAEAPCLTTTLLPGLLEAGARNAGRGNPDVSLYEVATVTIPRDSGPAPILPVDRRPSAAEWEQLLAAVPHQPLHLAVLLAGEVERAGWWGAGRGATWADAVDAVRDVADALGVELTVRQGSLAPWHPGRCAELRVGEELLGHAGELHPQVCRRAGLPARSAAAEIDLDALMSYATAPAAPRFSGFPVAKVDIALVVDAALPAAELEATVREGAGELLESLRLFDVYVGDQVGEGRKSLAFALRFRAPDRTLKDDEVTAARDAAVALAAERHGAQLR